MMKGSKFILCFILVFLCSNISLRGEQIWHIQRYLVLQYVDDLILCPINTNSQFKILPSEEIVVTTSDTEQKLYDINGLEGFGIVTHQDIITSVEDIIEDSDSQLVIRDINGVMVRWARNGILDLSGLEKGRIYIITKGSNTIKYMAL